MLSGNVVLSFHRQHSEYGCLACAIVPNFCKRAFTGCDKHLLVQLQGQLPPERWQARRQLRQGRQMLLLKSLRQILRRHPQAQQRQKLGLTRQERQKLGQGGANLQARQPPNLLLKSRALPKPQQSLLGIREGLLGARPSLLKVQQRRRQQPRAGQEWPKVALPKTPETHVQKSDRSCTDARRTGKTSLCCQAWLRSSWCEQCM